MLQLLTDDPGHFTLMPVVIGKESDLRAFQNLIGEHSIAGDPASLYNLIKSAPDPWSVEILWSMVQRC